MKLEGNLDGPAKPATARSQLLRGGRSVHVAVAQAIGTRIVSGEFPAGTVLPNEAEWAAEFDVSRSGVREAIKILMAKGLLTSRPGVGSRVEPKSRWNLLDHDVLAWYAEAPGRQDFLLTLQEFRRIFEPEAAALAAAKRTDEQMARISEACAMMGSANTLTERCAADVRFHLGILEASGNELLIPLVTLIDSALNRMFVLITREAGSLRHAQELHEAIERAIRRRRPAAARRAVLRLLENSDLMIDQIANGNRS
jgi:DNA-binding FadR family transcriptional regulator